MVPAMDRGGTVTALTAGAILAAASRAGVDTTAIVTRQGLSGVDLDDFAARITAEQLFGLWELVMRRTADPSLPVRAAHLPLATTRNQAALAAMTAPTIGAALQSAAALAPAWTTAYSLVLRPCDEGVGLGLDGLGVERLGQRCEAEFILSYILNAARLALGIDLRPRQVSFRHAAPPDLAAHRRWFGPGLEFGAAHSEIVFATELLSTPMGTGCTGLHELTTRHLVASGHSATVPSVTDQVRAVLAERLPTGAVQVGDVVRVLHVSPRTLHRQLAAEGTTFRGILERLRRQRALELLERSHTGTEQVASLLGFASVRGFHRAFRRWTGSSPRQVVARR